MSIRIAVFVSSLATLAVVESSASAQAESAPTGPEKGIFGLGLMVGEPSGLSAKLYLTDRTALAAGAGYAPFREGPQAHLDFLWHPFVLEARATFSLPLYIGLGGRLLWKNGRRGTEDHFRVGGRAVGGIQFDFTQVPLDAFAEGAFILELRTDGDAIGVDFNASAGVRYYF